LLLFVEIAQIRSYYGIEREFDRYFARLKNQLRGGEALDELDKDNYVSAVKNTFDRTKVWDNPDPSIDIETVHLRQGGDNSGLTVYEHLNTAENSLVCYIS